MIPEGLGGLIILEFLRFTLITIYVILSSFVGLLICIVRPFHPDNTYVMGRLIGKVVTRLLGLKVIIEDRDQFKKVKESGVVISNHQNNYDIFVIGQMTPRRTVSMGKKSIRLLPIFGQMYWLAGNILINRSNKKSAMSTMASAGEEMIRKHLKVWIMPEGTRSRGRGLLPFKKGAFHIAAQFDLPIMPVVLSSYEYHVNTKKWNAGVVKVKVLPPVDVAELKKTYNGDQFVNYLKDYCEELIKSELSKLDLETYGQESVVGAVSQKVM